MCYRLSARSLLAMGTIACALLAALVIHATPAASEAWSFTFQGGRCGYYGIDAPGVCAAFSITGLLAALASGKCRRPLLRAALAAIGSFAVMGAGSMLYGSLIGKFAVADRIVARAGELRGTERVLDIGSGSGLLALSFARLAHAHAHAPPDVRLTRRIQPVTCVDVWATRDQSGNSPERLIDNARREGLPATAVDVVTGDARELPGAWRDRFDLVVSSLALHNIREGDFSDAGRRERERAVLEVRRELAWRVLRRGGTLLVWDICPGPPSLSGGCAVLEYADTLRGVGAEVEVSGPLAVFGPSYLVHATKN